MLKIMMILILPLVYSCGGSDTKTQDVILKRGPTLDFKFAQTDPQFEPWRTQFEANYLAENGTPIDTDHIRINLDDSIAECPTCVGACFKWGTNREIIIIRGFWDNPSNNGFRDMIIYHELGHCALERGHNDEIHEDVPTSVMNSFLFDFNIYNDFENEYTKELMTGDDNDIKAAISASP